MKLFLISLGCSKNKVDSEMILGSLGKDTILVDDPKDADLILVNTCAFIESAKKEAIDTILDVSEYKKENSKLVVCGCLSQRYKNELVNLLPEVDRFITIDEYPHVNKIISDVMNSRFILDGEFNSLSRINTEPNYMRYIKISDGCLNRCAFCAIPLIRGKLKSREIDDIVSEVTKSVNEGAYEINLISQDTTKYGYDLTHRLMLVELLEELVKIPGDFKIRLLYLYPEVVTDELINFIKNNDKVMNYFDIPIQHSEDKILKAMYRRSNKEMIVNLFKKIRSLIPDAIIRTTLIVGFPYEENIDIDNLIDFIKDIKFDRLGAFTFSLEEGTKACEYPNIISEDEKIHRYERVMDTQREIALSLNKEKLNTIMNDCFIIGYDEESFMYLARSYAYAPDDIDGVIYVASIRELELGERVNIKVLDCDEYSLTGEVVE